MDMPFHQQSEKFEKTKVEVMHSALLTVRSWFHMRVCTTGVVQTKFEKTRVEVMHSALPIGPELRHNNIIMQCKNNQSGSI